MGWKTKGRLEAGLDDDLVVFTSQLEVVRTYCGGECSDLSS